MSRCGSWDERASENGVLDLAAILPGANCWRERFRGRPLVEGSLVHSRSNADFSFLILLNPPSPSKFKVVQSQAGLLNTTYLNEPIGSAIGCSPARRPHPVSLPGKKPGKIFVPALFTAGPYGFRAASTCAEVRHAAVSADD
jgi:hypothetical protein